MVVVKLLFKGNTLLVISSKKSRSPRKNTISCSSYRCSYRYLKKARRQQMKMEKDLQFEIRKVFRLKGREH